MNTLSSKIQYGNSLSGECKTLTVQTIELAKQIRAFKLGSEERCWFSGIHPPRVNCQSLTMR